MVSIIHHALVLYINMYIYEYIYIGIKYTGLKNKHKANERKCTGKQGRERKRGEK